MKHFLRPALAVTLVTLLLTTMLFPLSAATVLTEGVSILNPKANMSGPGYDWANRTNTLTLSNLNIETTDAYGLKIGDGATVILEGSNYIEASKAALYLEGDVIFRGNGSLTLVGGEYGILCHSTRVNKKLALNGGTFHIQGGIDGIASPYQKVAIGAVSLTVSGESYAINVRDLTTASGASIEAEGSFYTTHSMILQSSKLSIESEHSALLSDGTLKLENMTLSAGDSLAQLSATETYTGQKALKTVSTFDSSVKSLLFGEGVSIAVDILLVVALFLLLGAVIAIPILLKQRKAMKIIAARELTEAEEKRLRKLQKKSAKTQQ